VGCSLIYFVQAKWHRVWERKPLKFSIWVAVAVIVASLFEIVPTFLIKSNIPTIASVTPYTPLELVGRDIYVAEGCYNCHSQMIRPIRSETERYGEYSKPGEFVYDHPFQWGSRRIGPDLQRIGAKYPNRWHVRHMQDPRSTTPQSIMPAYGWLFADDLDYGGIQKRVDAMAMLGVPYGEAVLHAESMARKQAAQLSADIKTQGGPAGLEQKKIIALIAYLQRMGTDIKKLPASAPPTEPRAVSGNSQPNIPSDLAPIKTGPEGL
ncbi:MAG TPA: cytochrome-c oxidase, cbb3-type subunit II, partial [Polyangiaceae bacterium]